MELVDIRITMSKKLDRIAYKNKPYYLHNSLSKVELKDCYNIAEQIAKVSRFYKEEKIGIEKAKALYRKWVDNALNKTYSDGIFLG